MDLEQSLTQRVSGCRTRWLARPLGADDSWFLDVGGASPRARGGFSLIELIVCIGIATMCAGLVLPMLGRSVQSARLTADLAVIRSHGASLVQYAGANADLYPRASELRCGIGRGWYKPLLAEGFFDSATQADPRNMPRHDRVSFWMSDALGADPAEFTRGSTRPCDESPSSPVAMHQVPFPTAKGLMAKMFEHDGGPIGVHRGGDPNWFCCADLWEAAVAFCDGSAETGTYLDYSPRHEMPVKVLGHSVGTPILSPFGHESGRRWSLTQHQRKGEQ